MARQPIPDLLPGTLDLHDAMNLRNLVLSVRAVVSPRRVEAELDEELAFHIERETRKQIADGLNAADARALARFGPVPLAADECRDARGSAFLDGVVRDVSYAIRTFHRSLTSIAVRRIDPQRPGTSLMLRVTGDVEQARVALLDTLTRVDPALDHEVGTMRTIAGMGAYILQVAFWVTHALGALALTVSGRFSVLSYLVAQRAKEVGVRMALGATTPDIVALVLWQSARPVGFGLVADWPRALRWCCWPSPLRRSAGRCTSSIPWHTV